MKNWTWKNFTESEMACRETGEQGIKPELMDKLQAVRDMFNKPLVVSSGYRSPNHSAERKKKEPGSHSTGLAVDLRVSHFDAYRLVQIALQHGFTGIGIRQHGSERFVHLDVCPSRDVAPRPAIWTYE